PCATKTSRAAPSSCLRRAGRGKRVPAALVVCGVAITKLSDVYRLLFAAAKLPSYGRVISGSHPRRARRRGPARRRRQDPPLAALPSVRSHQLRRCRARLPGSAQRRRELVRQGPCRSCRPPLEVWCSAPEAGSFVPSNILPNGYSRATLVV